MTHPVTKSDPPEEKVHKAIQRWKWIGGLVLSIAGAGFIVATHLATYQTKDAARQSDERHERAHDSMAAEQRASKAELERMKIITVRIEGRQQNVEDRLDILLELARQRGGRAAGGARGGYDDETEARIEAIERRIQKRSARIDQLDGDDPLGGM